MALKSYSLLTLTNFTREGLNYLIKSNKFDDVTKARARRVLANRNN